MKNKNKILANMKIGTLAEPDNQKHLIKAYEWFNGLFLLYNGLQDKAIAESYWLLDQNAFGGNQPAPKFMKQDTLILGGLPVMLMLPNKLADSELKKQIKAENLDYVPIGFMDMHKISEGFFSTSGLGIAKAYQGMGFSKYLLYGAAKISGLKTLIIPTQLSNAPAHHSWMRLAPLEIMCSDVFHDEQDTIVYKANIPELEKILGPIPNKTGTFVPFSDIKKLSKRKKLYVIGYVSGEKGGVIVE